MRFQIESKLYDIRRTMRLVRSPAALAVLCIRELALLAALRQAA